MLRRIFIFIGLSLFTYGCQTNIAELPITSRDNQVYDNPYLKNISANTTVRKIAVVPEKEKITNPVEKQLSETLRSEIEASLSESSQFEPLARNEIPAILKDSKFNQMIGEGMQGKMTGSDYILVYKLNSFSMARPSGFKAELFKETVIAKAFQGYVKVNISLINLKTGEKEFSKVISGISDMDSTSSAINLTTLAPLNQAIENAVVDFKYKLANKFSPPSIVLQTKGAGKVALISLGSNSGVRVDDEIEFYFIKKKRGKELKLSFANGKVLKVQADDAWVEIENFEQVGVKENHFAKLK